MLFSQHTPTECMMTSRSMHTGKILRWHFVEYCIHHYCLLFSFIFVTVLASIASDSYFHGASLEYYYCSVCLLYVLPRSYFPVASALLLSCCFLRSASLLRCFLFSIPFWISVIVTSLPISLQVSWSVNAAIVVIWRRKTRGKLWKSSVCFELAHLLWHLVKSFEIN